jgi:hypothetical protein
MDIHECGGEKSYAIFGVSLSSVCQCDHDSEDHDTACCKDKTTTIKAKHQDKQINKTISAKNTLVDFDITSPIEFVKRDVAIKYHTSFAFSTKHPPDHSPPLYILYNVFLV